MLYSPLSYGDNLHYEKFADGSVKCIEDEIPFDLPEGWAWCRLSMVGTTNIGLTYKPTEVKETGTIVLRSCNIKNGKINFADLVRVQADIRENQYIYKNDMTYITTSNLYWDRFELDSLKEMLFADSEIDKCTVKKGDLLVCEGGDIGRSAIWMFEENIRIQNHIHRLRPYISLSNRFYYYVMYMWKQLGLIGGQGIGLQGFSSKMLHNLIVPLPSIDEQERIVAFIDKLFEQIESIEKSFS